MLRIHRRHIERATLLTAGLSLIFTMGACSAPEKPDPQLSGSSAQPSADDWNYVFSTCMKKAGFDPDGGFGMTKDGSGSTGFDMTEQESADFQKANTKCADEAGPAPEAPGGFDVTEMYEKTMVLAKCMRDAGFDYPDPAPLGQQGGGDGQHLGPAEALESPEGRKCSAKAGFDVGGTGR